MAAERKMITLKSSDGEAFEVDEAVAMESQTIKHMVEDDCADNAIPLPNVTSHILAKVIEYCRKHVEGRTDGDSTDVGKIGDENTLKKFDDDFVNEIKADQNVLFDLILVSILIPNLCYYLSVQFVKFGRFCFYVGLISMSECFAKLLRLGFAYWINLREIVGKMDFFGNKQLGSCGIYCWNLSVEFAFGFIYAKLGEFSKFAVWMYRTLWCNLLLNSCSISIAY